MISDLTESRKVTKPKNKPRSNMIHRPKRLRNCGNQVLLDMEVDAGLKTGRLPTSLLKKNKNSGSLPASKQLVYF